MGWKIPLFKTYWEDDDIEAVTRIIKRGTYWATGPEIEEFEKKIAEYVGTKYALTFNSGTSALHTLLLVHDVKGGEVIVPSFTFIATANAIILAGGTPVFAESEAETYGLDSEDVRRRINKHTKAIIALHYGGFPSKEIKELRRIADENNILLIEDAAESLGASIGKKKVGTFGDSAIFSFCQNKVISTGEGGVIVTDSKEVYEKAKYLRSHGRVELSEDYFSSVKDNDYIQVGYNFRMPTMSAALGLSQLNKINKIIEKRRKNAHYLNKNFSKIEGLVTPKELDGHYQVYQMYTVQVGDEKTRNALQQHLVKKGIMSKIYFNPVHLKTIYKEGYNYREGRLPRTEALSKKVLTLPLYADMRREELDYIISSVKEFFESLKR
ncbi:MAG TPA: DegT/DnrJ/EryC1/StrS family aminotransferase [candidate division WOR-3 bacterium]|uniref:DegT/DnrJ/EryC1/StrS family aminotransferase n=1 Tax=candidate division WOR-3 bacterium TaxID=2052148 RepID=A0A7C5DEI0_UNCW3|nr:DegT/DnrJ/EryC1/StrS family aminotransferase [candidate division WOR-3 bacterium]